MRAVTDLGLIGISAGGRAQVPAPSDVVNAPPIVGKANIRTTSIAQRFADPKAIEAKDYTAATRHDAVAALVRLADQLRAEDGGVTPGLFEGIDVYGVEGDEFLGTGNTTRRLPLTTFIAERGRLTQLLTTPIRIRATLPDEGAYFSDSADLSDNTVALMRQIEGRINLYRAAIARAQETLGVLRDAVARGNVRLIGIEDELAEARHDVGVAKSLLAEETERIAAHQSTSRQGACRGGALPRLRASARVRQPRACATAPGRSRLDRRAGAGVPRGSCGRARGAHRDAARRPRSPVTVVQRGAAGSSIAWIGRIC